MQPEMCSQNRLTRKQKQAKKTADQGIQKTSVDRTTEKERARVETEYIWKKHTELAK